MLLAGGGYFEYRFRDESSVQHFSLCGYGKKICLSSGGDQS